MSQTVLFEIGAVIFVAVSTAVFLYGLTIFRDWQDRDDTRSGWVSEREPNLAVAAPDGVVELVTRCSIRERCPGESRSSAA